MTHVSVGFATVQGHSAQADQTGQQGRGGNGGIVNIAKAGACIRSSDDIVDKKGIVDILGDETREEREGNIGITKEIVDADEIAVKEAGDPRGLFKLKKPSQPMILRSRGFC